MSEARLSPLNGAGRAFVAGTAFELSEIGYSQAEYVLSGTTCAYQRSAAGVRPCEHARFATRVLVYRPEKASAFNGTVWIEWHNVSGGLDAAPGWIFTHTELARSGAAWVGVSAQKVGVEGGEGILGLPSRGLVGVNPDRYGKLRHPGDRFSYDIFRLATEAIRSPHGTILDDLAIERVIATGDSQSAFRLTTYVNEIDPVARLHDGFMIHARGGASAPLDDQQDPSSALRGDPVLFREDLRVPVMCVEAETDLINLRYVHARQADAENLAVWEIAGASHADVYTFVVGPKDTGRLAVEDLAKLWRPEPDFFGTALEKPVNAGPQHYVRNAAVSQLERWVRDGVRPPESQRLETSGTSVVTGPDGNVLGGVRTPHVDVPVAVLSGLGNSGGPIAFLCGSTVAFSREQLSELYGSKEHYLARFDAATSAAVTSGFVLEADAPEVRALAAANCPL
jgi:Alpha/beta hydrolase domain